MLQQLCLCSDHVCICTAMVMFFLTNNLFNHPIVIVIRECRNSLHRSHRNDGHMHLSSMRRLALGTLFTGSRDHQNILMASFYLGMHMSLHNACACLPISLPPQIIVSLLNQYPMRQPSSTGRLIPVMKDAASDDRNTIRVATSSGCSMRPIA